MSKAKSYKETKQKSQAVSEPIAAYGTVECNVESYLDTIPEKTMRTLVDSAIEDYEMGHCTSHSQMDSWIKERMGWK